MAIKLGGGLVNILIIFNPWESLLTQASESDDPASDLEGTVTVH